jgi:hypothetical protein
VQVEKAAMQHQQKILRHRKVRLFAVEEIGSAERIAKEKHGKMSKRSEDGTRVLHLN